MSRSFLWQNDKKSGSFEPPYKIFGLFCFFLVYLLDQPNCSYKEQQCRRPHDNTAEYASERCAQSCDNVGYCGDARYERRIRKLRIYVTYVVTLRTRGCEDGRIRNGRNVVAEYRSAKRCSVVNTFLKQFHFFFHFFCKNDLTNILFCGMIL